MKQYSNAKEKFDIQDSDRKTLWTIAKRLVSALTDPKIPDIPSPELLLEELVDLEFPIISEESALNIRQNLLENTNYIQITQNALRYIGIFWSSHIVPVPPLPTIITAGAMISDTSKYFQQQNKRMVKYNLTAILPSIATCLTANLGPVAYILPMYFKVLGKSDESRFLMYSQRIMINYSIRHSLGRWPRIRDSVLRYDFSRKEDKLELADSIFSFQFPRTNDHIRVPYPGS